MKNWKTTLSGVLVLLGTVITEAAKCLQTGGQCDYGMIIMGVASAVGLFFAKDFNVSHTQQ